MEKVGRHLSSSSIMENQGQSGFLDYPGGHRFQLRFEPVLITSLKRIRFQGIVRELLLKSGKVHTSKFFLSHSQKVRISKGFSAFLIFGAYSFNTSSFSKNSDNWPIIATSGSSQKSSSHALK